MHYPDQDYYITFLFEQLEDFNSTVGSKHIQTHGCPKSYADNSLIVLFAILTLKDISSFKAQHRWLKIHPHWLLRCNLQSVPSRSTLSRRYKQLSLQLELFIVYLGNVSTPLIANLSPEVAYQDKSLFKVKGPVWHQKDRRANHVPKGTRALDKDASWSRSNDHGWVYGYGLHPTVCQQGFPRMSIVDTGCVSEKAAFDRQIEKLLEQNVGYVVADAGYTDLKRAQQLAKKGVFALDPCDSSQESSCTVLC